MLIIIALELLVVIAILLYLAFGTHFVIAVEKENDRDQSKSVR